MEENLKEREEEKQKEENTKKREEEFKQIKEKMLKNVLLREIFYDIISSSVKF